MAKIFKVSGYFMDANGVVDKEKFEGKLESLAQLLSSATNKIIIIIFFMFVSPYNISTSAMT